MGVPRTHYFSYDSKIPKQAILGYPGNTLNAKIVAYKYRESQSCLKGSNSTIYIEVVNIWGAWFTKQEIEACL